MKIELISQLALMAGLNTAQAKPIIFRFMLRLGKKKQKLNQLKRCEFDALKARAGFLISPGWENFKIYVDKLYSLILDSL